MERRLLLLNASNYPRNVVYPYAFVQVSALARRAGFRTTRHDLLTQLKTTWRQHIQRLIAEHQPTLIGVHLRQTDSQFIEEYDRSLFRNGEKSDYFPLEDTRYLIRLVREETDCPIIIGGFGFTNAPVEIFEYLKPDYAIEGEPDDFFARYDEILVGNSLEHKPVHNLVYQRGHSVQRGSRTFFDPNPETEYTQDVFDDLVRFYSDVGRTVSVGRLGEVDVPVEISRGCPYSCAFCTEPHVKGKQTRYRDLDVVVEELSFLSARGVRSVWFVCSELNIAGSDFALALAERMIHFNEQRPGREVIWKAYSLPRPVIKEQEWKTLVRSGYVPGWNGVTSFSDTNLRSMRVPYRSRDAVQYLQSISQVQPMIREKIEAEILKIEMFLGNAHATVATVRESLRTINNNELFSQFDYKEIIRGTRLYRSTLKAMSLPNDTPQDVYGAGPDREPYIFPTYVYPPALVQHFGSAARLIEFFDFIESTVFNESWKNAEISAHRFLRKTLSEAFLTDLMRASSKYQIYANVMKLQTKSGDVSVETLKDSFDVRVIERTYDIMTLASGSVISSFMSEEIENDPLEEGVAELILKAVWDMTPGLLKKLLSEFKLDADDYAEAKYSQYEIISAVFSVVSTRHEFKMKILPRFNLEQRIEAELMFEWLLARHGIELCAEYQPFFVDEHAAEMSNLV